MAREYSSESSQDERDKYRRHSSKRESNSTSRRNTREDDSDSSDSDRRNTKKRDERREKGCGREAGEREVRQLRESSDEEGELVERDTSGRKRIDEHNNENGLGESRDKDTGKGGNRSFGEDEKEAKRDRDSRGRERMDSVKDGNRSSDEDEKEVKRDSKGRERSHREENGERRRENVDSYRSRDRDSDRRGRFEEEEKEAKRDRDSRGRERMDSVKDGDRSSDEDEKEVKRDSKGRERSHREENGERRRENVDSYRSRDRDSDKRGRFEEEDRRRTDRRRDDDDDDEGHRRERRDRRDDDDEGHRRDRRRYDDEERRRGRRRDDVGDMKYRREKGRNEQREDGRSLKEKHAAEDLKVQKGVTMQGGNQDSDAVNLGKMGGIYIPPHRLAQMRREVEDKSSVEYQKLTWEALYKSINGLVNKVNAANIKNIIPELFSENLIRGRALFCRACMKSQMASPGFTDVFAALVAVVNTKFPEVGELLLRRMVLQLKRAYKRNDKPRLLAAVKFIAHLVNQQVAHEIVALELLAVLLGNPTDDSVEVAVGFVTECGSMLQDVSPKGLDGAFERFRGILHEGEIDKRVQFLIEGLFALRKAKFQGYPAVRPELDLVEQEDQLTHEISLEDEMDEETNLNLFREDPNFLENEQRYEELKKSIIGEESGDEEGSDAASGDEDEDEESEEEDEDDEEQMQIRDETETNLINLRRTIYLTIMSSVDFEEAGHKLMKIKLEPGQEMELCIMLLECCSQERTYLRYYGLLGQRFCMINKVYQENFEKCFVQQYSMIHRLETNKLRNVAKFFAHLLGTDALPWQALAYIRLTEEDTTSSSRIFIKILFQELSEHLGIRTLNERLTEPTMQDTFESIFPRDNPKNTRFSINFFTSIGLGGITENLREYLKNMPRLIMQQPQSVSESEPGSESDSESGSSSSSDSGSGSSESESDSSSSDEDRRGKKRSRSSDRYERHRKQSRR